jgi:hypothetical protein
MLQTPHLPKAAIALLTSSALVPCVLLLQESNATVYLRPEGAFSVDGVCCKFATCPLEDSIMLAQCSGTACGTAAATSLSKCLNCQSRRSLVPVHQYWYSNNWQHISRQAICRRLHCLDIDCPADAAPTTVVVLQLLLWLWTTHLHSPPRDHCL